jgi:hypothetical protein
LSLRLGREVKTMNEETMFVLRAMAQKSREPRRYLEMIGENYRITQDARLLRYLPDAALGRTSQQVVPMATELRHNVLGPLLNETPVDEIMQRIEELRAAKPTPTDSLALDLLEVSIRWRAAHLLNSPEKHVAACVAALKRVGGRAESPADAMARAGYVRHLGKSTHSSLVGEQREQLRSLLNEVKSGSRERLRIALDLAATI